jgi:Skp family chaperone for outer membrane proteins
MVTENEEVISHGVATEAGEEDSGRETELLVQEIKTKAAVIARLEQALAAREADITALQQSLSDMTQKLEDIGKSLAQAVARYREMVIEVNPGVLAEMITGDSVEEVDKSVQNARVLVGKVRQEMEAEASSLRVPAGSPQRLAPDLSGLSPREKIQYAIGGS